MAEDIPTLVVDDQDDMQVGIQLAHSNLMLSLQGLMHAVKAKMQAEDCTEQCHGVKGLSKEMLSCMASEILVQFDCDAVTNKADIPSHD